jgi:hypothetical protein
VDRVTMTGLDNAERMVLISARRGEPIAARFTPHAHSLIAMGFAASVAPDPRRPAEHRRVMLTRCGASLASAYLASHIGRVWLECASRLTARVSWTDDREQAQRWAQWSREAHRRALAAALRANRLLDRAEHAIGEGHA